MDISAVFAIPLIILLITILALIGKWGGYDTCSLCRFFEKKILAIGFSMNARGIVSIIIADIVLKAGLINQTQGGSVVLENIFSAVVIMAVITTLMTPIAFKSVFKS